MINYQTLINLTPILPAYYDNAEKGKKRNLDDYPELETTLSEDDDAVKLDIAKRFLHNVNSEDPTYKSAALGWKHMLIFSEIDELSP